MRRAFSLLKRSDSYRADAFRRGLERHGFRFEERYRKDPGPGDLLLMWNRVRAFDPLACSYEQAGATVLVAENGYLAPRLNLFDRVKGPKLFALARGRHNGQGEWPIGDEPRTEFELRPWRECGDHILVLPQRGIGVTGQGMPALWLPDITRRLEAATKRPVRVRKHPGPGRPDPWPDLKGAHCAVTWGSGAALKAICHGIPVFHEMRGWIGATAARHGIADLEDCFTGARGPMLHRLSWAQWSAEEIESGEAFARLI